MFPKFPKHETAYNAENLDIHDDLLVVAAHEDGVLLYDISNPWGSNYSRILIPSSEFFLRNPIDKINDSIISMGLSCEDCEIFMCNWTRKTLVTFNIGDKLFKKTYYKIYGNFKPLKEDYSKCPGNWRKFTSDEYARYYGDLIIYKGVKQTFTNAKKYPQMIRENFSMNTFKVKHRNFRDLQIRLRFTILVHLFMIDGN